MNVTITEDPRLADIEVAVSCPRIDESVQRIVAGLNAFERKLTGERDGATYRLDIDGICYVETVDGRTFLYTEDAVYRTPLRLYELAGAYWRETITDSPLSSSSCSRALMAGRMATTWSKFASSCLDARTNSVPASLSSSSYSRSGVRYTASSV